MGHPRRAMTANNSATRYNRAVRTRVVSVPLLFILFTQGCGGGKHGRAVSIDMPIHVQVAKRSSGEAAFTKGDARWYADCFLMSLCHGVKTEDFAPPGQSWRPDDNDRAMPALSEANGDEATLM